MAGEFDKDEMARAVAEAISAGIEKVLEEPVIPRVPGAVIGATKVPYSRRDIERVYQPMVTFIPEENIPVTVQGVQYDLYADREITVPYIVKNIYEEHKKAERARGRGVTLSSGEYVPVTGVGGLPPE